MDLLSILPSFPTKPYTHILPPLERNNINTVDLITLDTLEIAKRAHVPPADVRRLSAQIVDALHRDVGFERDIAPEDLENTQSSSLNNDAAVVPGVLNRLNLSQWGVVSTLDPAMDGLLEGGIPAGYVTEVTGESGSGKTQFLLSLLLAVQLPSPKGLSKRAIYISTEAPLATPRLSQYLDSNPYLSTLPPNQQPSLQNVLSINAMDLESQDHILNYQLPVAIARYNVGLVIIDSITANFRAEHLSHDVNSLSTRSGELAKLGHMLRNLAAREDIAIVVANQVSDRFDPIDNNNPYIASRMPPTATVPQPTPESPMPKSRLAPGSGAENNIDLIQIQNQHPPSSSPAFPSSPFPLEEDPQFDGSYLVGNPVRNETLSLIHQQRFFTGWGDSPSSSLLQRQTPKTPALGFVWTTQIACRIALKKDESGLAFDQGDYDDGYMSTPGYGSGTSQSQDETPASTDKPDPFSTAKTIRDNPEANITANPEQEQPSEQTPASKPPPSMPPPPKSMERTIKRTMKVVFAPWTVGSTIDEDSTATIHDEVDFEIWTGGLRSVGSQSEI